MRRAFTLAEVLITLGIIGVVSAITIPGLMTKYQQIRDVNRLKKVYAELTQAFRAANQDNDLYTIGENWQNTQEIVDAIKPYIKYSSDYSNSEYVAVKAMCYIPERKHKAQDNSYKWLSGCGISNPIADATSSIELSNGAFIGFNRKNKNIIIDTNGSYNGPNKMGHDVFLFTINEDSNMIPFGNNMGYDKIVNSANGCRKNNTSCGSGQFCAARIIQDGWSINYY